MTNNKNESSAGSFDPGSNTADHVLRMQTARVFVLGDVILDQYIRGSVSRISPEAPVPVLLEETRQGVLGGAGNVAANIASFGAQVLLAGRIGDDADGREVLHLAETLGIQTIAVVKHKTLPTTRKLRLLAGYQQMARIDREEIAPLDASETAAILKSFEVFVASPGARALVLSDYGKGVCTPELTKAVIAAAKRTGTPVITDPKSLDLSRYSGSSVIKPNRSEGRQTLRRLEPSRTWASSDDEAIAICDAVLKESGAENIVLSMSEGGVITKGKRVTGTVRFKATALQVADVSGAGDTMIAFLAMGEAAGLSLERSVELANIAAGVVCGKLGTATLSPAEFLSACNAVPRLADKLVSAAEMVQIAAQYRREGRSLVFTNGCFDLLHAGHVQLLQRARALGDVLILGLNTDASVKRLKGPTRPIQNEKDRAMILSGLSCVDFVVLFGEDTPLELIKAVRPHVLVKGGDYRPDQVVGAAEMITWGGRVETLPLLEGRSTTNIVHRASTP
jgi:D-beta-D-heptose 7-phosphate kinase/D-beta-D-heptose 1-phosphate adenosyltransferase